MPDIQAAKRFYIDVLGLDVERDHPTFVQFSHFAIANDESLSGSRDPEVYWLVDDAAAAFTELSQRADVTLHLTQRPYGKVFGIAEPSGSAALFVGTGPGTTKPSRAMSVEHRRATPEVVTWVARDLHRGLDGHNEVPKRD